MEHWIKTCYIITSFEVLQKGAKEGLEAFFL